MKNIKDTFFEMRVLQFEASQLVSGQTRHTVIRRHKPMNIDIIPRTFEFFRLEVKDNLSPLVLSIKYERKTDLKVSFSRSNK